MIFNSRVGRAGSQSHLAGLLPTFSVALCELLCKLFCSCVCACGKEGKDFMRVCVYVHSKFSKYCTENWQHYFDGGKVSGKIAVWCLVSKVHFQELGLYHLGFWCLVFSMRKMRISFNTLIALHISYLTHPYIWKI